MPEDEKDLTWLNIKIDQLNEINDKKISELKEQVQAYRTYQDNCSYTDNIKEVLREFNEALLGKNIIGISFYKDIKKKLNGGDSPRIKTFKKAGLNVVSSEDELKEFFKNGGDSIRIGEMTHEEGAKYELDHPDEFDEKPPKCEHQWYGTGDYIICNKCNLVSDLKPEEKPPEPKGKTLICPNCMRQYEFKHREYKIVEKADLETNLENMDWILNEMYATHYNTELYQQILTEYNKFKEKYLTEEAEKKE